MNPRTRRSSLPGPTRFLPAFVLGATFCLPISAQQMRTLPAGETARFEAADALSDMDAASIPNGPTPEAVRSLYATIDMQHKSLRPLLDRWGKARRQLELMPEASNAALLEHLLQEIKDYLDPANLIGQKQEMERRLAVPDVAGAYEALRTYAKQREADRPVAWGRVDYVDLRLRTQEKAARLERIAAATGGPAPLGDAIALLERNLATREQDMTQPLPRFARTAELEGLLKLYDTAYDDVQRRAAEVASRQPHGTLQDHKSTRGCADATPDGFIPRV